MKINPEYFVRNALNEYTDLIIAITKIKISNAGSTGFLEAMEKTAKDELIKFSKAFGK